jgi:hypothetical protein
MYAIMPRILAYLGGYRMKSPVYRLFVERKRGFDSEARRTLAELTGFVGISTLEGVRYLNRYDVEGIEEATLKAAETRVFSEPQSDVVYRESFPMEEGETALAIEYLPAIRPAGRFSLAVPGASRRGEPGPRDDRPMRPGLRA